MTAAQLDFAGNEVDVIATSRPSPLTPVQLAIMAHVDRHGSIRSVEAGVIVHAARSKTNHFGKTCGGGAKGHGPTREACCPYAASDGYEALRRLAKRALIVQDAPRAPFRRPDPGTCPGCGGTGRDPRLRYERGPGTAECGVCRGR